MKNNNYNYFNKNLKECDKDIESAPYNERSYHKKNDLLDYMKASGDLSNNNEFIKNWELAIKNNPGKWWPYEELVKFLEAQNSTDDNIEKVCTRFMKYVGNKIEWLEYYMIIEYLKSKPIEFRDKFWRLFIQNVPDKLSGYLNLGNLLKTQGKYDEALEVSNNAINKLEGEELEVGNYLKEKIYVEYIESLEKTENYNEALDVCNRFIKDYPNLDKSYTEKIRILELQGNFENIIRVWNEYIINNPHEQKGYHEKESIFLKQNKLENVIDVWNEYIINNPHEQKGYHKKESIFLKQNKLENVIDVWSHYIKNNPDKPKGYKLKVNSLILAKQHGDAQFWFSYLELADLNFDEILMMQNLAESEFKKGKLMASYIMLSSIKDCVSKNQELYSNHSMMYICKKVTELQKKIELCIKGILKEAKENSKIAEKYPFFMSFADCGNLLSKLHKKYVEEKECIKEQPFADAESVYRVSYFERRPITDVLEEFFAYKIFITGLLNDQESKLPIDKSQEYLKQPFRWLAKEIKGFESQAGTNITKYDLINIFSFLEPTNTEGEAIKLSGEAMYVRFSHEGEE